MKTNLTLLFLLLTTANFAQTIRRVNADATVTGTNVYTTLQAAHNAATAGDILIVEPGASVGPLNCTKTLSIYGRGYFLQFNPDYAQLPNNQRNAETGAISIFASNCKISGLYIGNGFNITVNGGASGTIISRNLFLVSANIIITGGAGAPVNNTTITQNYLYGGNISMNGAATGFVNNITITNNAIFAISFSATAAANYFSNVLINQNTIYAVPTTGGNAVISNNIFSVTSVDPNINLTNTTFNNNVTFGTSTINAGLGANNIVIANIAGQFLSNVGGSGDNNYRVDNSSAIKTASSSGGEVGMFGGATPYVQYGIPATPAIIKLLNTGIGNSTTPITATVSATSNN